MWVLNPGWRGALTPAAGAPYSRLHSWRWRNGRDFSRFWNPKPPKTTSVFSCRIEFYGGCLKETWKWTWNGSRSSTKKKTCQEITKARKRLRHCKTLFSPHVLAQVSEFRTALTFLKTENRRSWNMLIPILKLAFLQRAIRALLQRAIRDLRH